MDAQKSHIVISLAGRDKGQYFLVIDKAEGDVLLADGKGRKLEKPKKKKLRHVRVAGESDSRAAQKIRSGEKLLNSEIRKALAEFTETAELSQGGS